MTVHRKLNEAWTAHVVSRAHRCNISHKELADACGYTPSYLSAVLHCNKKFRSETSKEITKNRILATLAKLEDEILKENTDEL